MSKLKAWDWTNGSSQSRARQEIIDSGYSWFKMPEAIEMGANEPALLVEKICGKRPVRVDMLDITPVKGQTTYVQSSREARFHTDNDPSIAANLQILICKTPAKDGGDSWLMDSWAIANEIKKRDKALFEALFSHARLFNFVTGLAISPTFSKRQKNLLITHAPYPIENDAVGAALQAVVDQAPFDSFRSSPGEVVVASNHRLLHGRSEFKDQSRHLIRILAWLDQPIEKAPPSFIERAEHYHEHLLAVTQDASPWLRARLGISSSESEIARLDPEFRSMAPQIRGRIEAGLRDLGGLIRETGRESGPSTVDSVVQAMVAAGVNAIAGAPLESEQLEVIFDMYERLHNRRSIHSARKLKSKAKPKSHRAAPKKAA